MKDNLECKVVPWIAVIIIVPFIVNIFYYGPSEGTWFTFVQYDLMFGYVGDRILNILDIFFLD